MLRIIYACILWLGLLATPAVAHNKSLSFSEWIWDGERLSVSFTAPARDVTLLPEIAPARDLSHALAMHVETYLRLIQINTPCRLERGFTKSPAHDGYIRVSGRFRCFNNESTIEIQNNAFFNLARSHVHFARLSLSAGQEEAATEILFTATQRNHLIAPGEDGQIARTTKFSDAMNSHFWLGVDHILTGIDHLAFVFCLLLIGGTRRNTLWLITGFTLGHSITLALAVLGFVTANAPVVEALIGFSILLVAAERILGRNGLMPVTGVVLTLVFFVLSFIYTLLPTGFGSGLGLGVWAGLMLFCLTYGGLIKSEADTKYWAPMMTVAFGLVHGFGFAGLLVDIGLPTDALAPALLGFNLGIEVGQLLIFVPLVVFGPYLLEELPKPPISWSDMAAFILAAFGMFLFVSRALI